MPNTIDGIDFDEKWYLAQYSDVAAAIANGNVGSAIDHYLKHGKEEGRLARRPAGSRDKIVHVHIPKTAGTSIRGAFQRAGKKVLSATPNFRYDESRHGMADVITGHIGYARARECKGKLLTILRDPVDRFLSYYYHLVNSYERKTEVTTRTTLAWKYALDEFIFIDDCPDLLTDIHNSMTWQLVNDMNIAERTSFRLTNDASDSNLLKIAKENLSEFSVVGFQEQMGKLAELVKRSFGVEMDLKHENKNPRESNREDIDIRTIKCISNRVYLDVELYNWSLHFFSRNKQ